MKVVPFSCLLSTSRVAPCLSTMTDQEIANAVVAYRNYNKIFFASCHYSDFSRAIFTFMCIRDSVCRINNQIQNHLVKLTQ